MLPEILQPPSSQPLPMLKGAMYMGLVTGIAGILTRDNSPVKSALIAAATYVAFGLLTREKK